MNEIQVFARRGGNEIISKLILNVEHKSFVLPEVDIDSQYNIRYIFEVAGKNSAFPESLFGTKISEADYGDVKTVVNSSVSLKSIDDVLDFEIKLPFLEGFTSFNVKIFHDKPAHNYGVLEALPIPIEVITIYFAFKQDNATSKEETIEKYFDGYSHLGFALVDIERMKKILFEEYGDKTLDLIQEFSSTEIVDKLFDAGVLIITWGINPYTYPIYSGVKSKRIDALLGEPFDQKGTYHIAEDIEQLSIIPGHELRNWPALLEKDFPKITLFGSGNFVTLQPYYLEHDDFEKVIASFLIYREHIENSSSVPLLNIDLLH